MESTFVRAAVVQLDYHPALYAQFRSPLEDPGGITQLLPSPSEVPRELERRFAMLRGRVREAYNEQLLRRIVSILEYCKSNDVKIVLLPEYSVPWDILEELAHRAGSMVVVAGTHRVERDGLRSGVYERLGCAEASLPKLGQAVAPVLYGGRLLGLVPKFHAATAVNEEIEAGDTWQPITMPEGFPGPMGVLICLDFLARETPLYRKFVAERLSECRFLAVPSWTSRHSVSEFDAKAWEEAKRYGRPVLYADHASGGGTAFFVDEEKHSGLLPYPEKPGRLRPNEEGVLIADIDMGYERRGGSTRYVQERPVKPIVAATLIYSAKQGEAEYMSWYSELAEIANPEKANALDHALVHVAKHRKLLERVRETATPTRKERLDRLVHQAQYIASLAQLEQLANEFPLVSAILPMDVLRAAYVTAAKEIVVRWMKKHPELAKSTSKLLEEAAAARLPALVDEATKRIDQEKRAVRGRVEGDVSPAEYCGRPHSMVARNGTTLTFRRHARELEMRMSPKQASEVIGWLPKGAYEDLPFSEHTPQDNRLALPAHGVDMLSADCAAIFSELIAAEGTEPVAAIAIGSAMLWRGGLPVVVGPRITLENGKIFLLIRRNNQWVLATYEPTIKRIHRRPSASNDDPEEIEEEIPSSKNQRMKLDDISRLALCDAFEEWGIEIEGFEVVDDEAFRTRADVILHRFEGARETIQALKQRRLSDVDGHFIAPSLAHVEQHYEGLNIREERIVEPAFAALEQWLRPDRQRIGRKPNALILLGEYGSGKSTLLTEWASRLWDTPNAPRPLLVDLAGTSAKSPRAMLLEAAQLPDTPENRAALRLGIRLGKIFPIFDGFDEMATRITAAELPQKLTDLFDTAEYSGRVVLSSRDHYFPTKGEMNKALESALTASFGGPTAARRFDTCFFAHEQIQSLIHAVIDDATQASALWERIRTTYDLEELCKRPILLGMILAVRHELLGRDVVSRADLYEACLRRWLSQARGPEPEIFTIEQKRRLAQTIAIETWRNDQRGVTLARLRDLLKDTFSPAFFDNIPRTAEVLEATGGMFLVRQLDDDGDRYRFAHKSFQEYFLASAIVEAGERGAASIADVFNAKPFTKEVSDFVNEILAGARGALDSSFVTNVRRWLLGRGRTRDQGPSTTADAAANAARLLIQLARLRGHSEGWIPDKADLRNVVLNGEDLRGVRLTGAKLDDANLSYAKLDQANFEGANLREARLHGARFNGTHLRNVDASGANFTLATALKTNLDNARLDKAILRQSVWVDCWFSGATFDEADMTAWMTRGAEGLGGNILAARKNGSARVELALDDTDYGWKEVVAGHCHADGARLTVVTLSGSIVVIDCQSRQRLAYIPNAISDAGNAKFRFARHADVAAWLNADGTVHVFDFREFRVCRKYVGRFTDVAISDDGTRLALANAEEGIRIVESTSQDDESAVFPPLATQVLDMAFAPSGETLAISYANGNGLLWRFKREDSGRCDVWYAGEPIRRLVFHPHEEILASFSGDCFIRFWDTSRIALTGEMLTPEVELSAVSYSPNGAFLAGLSSTGILRTWDVEQRQEVSRIEVMHGASRNAITWTADESQLVSLGRVIEFCDHRNGVPVFTMGTSAGRLPRGIFDEVFWSRKADRLLCLGRAPTSNVIIELQSGKISSIPHGQNKRLVGYGEDNLLLAIIEEKLIQHLDLAGQPIGASRQLVPVPEHSPIVMRYGGDVFLVAISDGYLHLWDCRTSEIVGKWLWSRFRPRTPIRNKTGESLALMVDEELVVLRHGHDKIIASLPSRWWRLWDWLPSGERIVFVGDEGILQTWVPGNEPEAAALSFPAATCLQSHPTKPMIAVGKGEGTISVVDMNTLAVLVVMKNHRERVSRIEWSPDGSRLASIDDLGMLCVWDPVRGELLLELTTAGDVVLARTPEGYCEFVGGAPDDFRLSVTTDKESGAQLYLPVGDLREILHRPDKLAAAFRGDLTDDDIASSHEWIAERV